MLESIIASFTFALLGSLHCIGMCGPLAIVVGTASDSTPRRLLTLTAYTMGKNVTYVILGIAAGIIGSAFLKTGLGKGGMAALSATAGVLMVGMGVQLLVVKFRAKKSDKESPVAALLTRVLQNKNPATPVIAGMLTGLLPCGFLWAGLLISLKSGSLVAGGLIMLAFGVGTMPSLIATGTLSGLLSTRVRKWGEVVAAVAILIMGAMSIFRAVMILVGKMAGHAEAAVSCCGH